MMLEIRHALPAELAEAASFYFSQEGRAVPEAWLRDKVMLARQGEELLAVLFYQETARELTIRYLALRGPLSGEIERCMTAVLIQKALRQGVAAITCPPRGSGFIAESFERRGEVLYLRVFEKGWTVLENASRCQCHREAAPGPDA